MSFLVTDHRLLLERTIVYSHLLIALGYLEIWEAFQGQGFLGTIGGLSGTWWHCRAKVMCMKVLLLGWDEETMDRSVLEETYLGIPSTPA